MLKCPTIYNKSRKTCMNKTTRKCLFILKFTSRTKILLLLHSHNNLDYIGINVLLSNLNEDKL